jgi:ribose transport system substrate-binding protein
MSKKAIRYAALLAAPLAWAIATLQPTSAAEPVVIGFTSLGFFVPALAEARDGAMAKAKELGVTIEYITADDAPTQQRAVENLLAKKVSVLAIDPNDSQAISEAVQLANQSKVPVVMWMGGATSGKVATLVASDETEGGYAIAHWVFEKMGKNGKVALLQGDKAHQAGFKREEGFHKAMTEFPGIELAGYGEGKWARDVGERVANNMLTQGPGIAAIVALNDEMAHGAVAAAQQRGTNIMVTGYNGQCDAIKAVLDGSMAATLYQPFRDIGAKVVEVSVAAAKGESLPPTVEMPAVVLDKPLAEQIIAGTAANVSPGMIASVKAAATGCK